nr:immunoglobulin light chain junction region [Macaca mulatta]MOV66262.1 immunoglobulin light chain junction region [Macaca mulatta]MOV67799.1 immunoglobulin light chain junction region [Macaca mulatta]MOV67932.1 immunoglobulin light chain junction region [Macaca mulatta]MOV68510.1 immunoglobulin light chain junction region [Macaca mulatta]
DYYCQSYDSNLSAMLF